jgi:hypothetical protein
MIAVAVFNTCFGGLVILMGLFLALGVMAFTLELLRLGGGFEIPVARAAFALLVLATGIVGLVAGIGMLKPRHWARTASLAFASLLIMSCVLSFFAVPAIASIGTIGASDLRAVDTFDLVRLALFVAIFIAIPVIYAPILCIVFNTRAWKTAFAEGAI